MTTFKLRLVGFGGAKALTRDGMGERFIETDVYDSLYPPAG